MYDKRKHSGSHAIGVGCYYHICHTRFSQDPVSYTHLEAVSELDFYASMNLQPCEGRLKTRPREKARVCYLIFLMGETLPIHHLLQVHILQKGGIFLTDIIEQQVFISIFLLVLRQRCV